MIGQIAVVPSTDSRVQELTKVLDGVTPKDDKVVFANLLGSDVRRAFIFKAQHPPVAPATTPELAAAYT